jgi:hypothetical protein
MKHARILIAALVIVIFSGPAFADSLVTNGATVSTVGSGFDSTAATNWNSTPGIYNPNAIVNGLPQADGTQWNQNTAYWSGPSPDASDILTITLSATATIDKIILQADDNDSYQVKYWNGSSWQLLNTFPAVGGFGMATRATYFPPSPIATGAFEITAASGDGFYAVGQFSAYGTRISATPEPSTLLFGLTGVALLGLVLMNKREALI